MKNVLLLFSLLYATCFAGTTRVETPGPDRPANTVQAGPVSGAAAQPAFRALVEGDIGADTINNAALKTDSVTETKVQDSAITGNKIAEDSIDDTKINGTLSQAVIGNISTPGKVNVTAITGTLPTTNGGTGSNTAPTVPGQLPVASAGLVYVPKTVTGDASMQSSGALTVTKVNGVSYATPSAGGYVLTGNGALDVPTTSASWALLDLTGVSTKLSGTLPVNKGGTGETALNAGGVLIGNGTNPISSLTPGAGQIFMGNATPEPAWTVMSGEATISATGVVTLSADIMRLATVQTVTAMKTFSVDTRFLSLVDLTASGTLVRKATNNEAFLQQRNAANDAYFNILFLNDANHLVLNDGGSGLVDVGNLTTQGQFRVLGTAGSANKQPILSLFTNSSYESVISQDSTTTYFVPPNGVLTNYNDATVQAGSRMTLTNSGELTIGRASTATGKVSFKNSTNANNVSLSAGVSTENADYALPVAKPTSVGQALTSTTGGAMSWTNAIVRNDTLTIGAYADTTGPSEVTPASTQIKVFEVPDGSNKGIVASFICPSDIDLSTTNPEIEVQFIVTATTAIGATARIRLNGRYVNTTQNVDIAAEDALGNTVTVTNTLKRLHTTTFTLDRTKMAAGDQMIIEVNRFGSDIITDLYLGSIGFLRELRFKYKAQ